MGEGAPMRENSSRCPRGERGHMPMREGVPVSSTKALAGSGASQGQCSHRVHYTGVINFIITLLR